MMCVSPSLLQLQPSLRAQLYPSFRNNVIDCICIIRRMQDPNRAELLTANKARALTCSSHKAPNQLPLYLYKCTAYGYIFG